MTDKLSDSDQLVYIVDAISDLSRVLNERKASLQTATDAATRSEHLRHIAAAAGSMRSAAWSLTNLAMTLAEKGARK
jgi:hypothetical protein